MPTLTPTRLERATIGYGTTRYVDGRKVQQGDKINVIEANELLASRRSSALPISWPAACRHGKKCA
jgi:hypothetical protein